MKSLTQLLSDWKEASNNMNKLRERLPNIIGVESVKVVKDNFKLQGYDSGTGLTNWDARKESTNKAYDKRSGVKGSVYNSKNPILLQTRNLYNSIKYKVQGMVVFIGVNTSLIPYAEAMNKRSKYMPANEAPNKKMLKTIENKIVRLRNKALKNFQK